MPDASGVPSVPSASDAPDAPGAPRAGLRTPRLLLRPWRPEDLAPFAELNADPEVTAHFPAPLDRAASDALAARVSELIEEQGWGLWAVEVVATGAFAGFTGLSRPAFEAPFTPAVEVGWRLARSAWGHGYATEAATAALDFAFDELDLAEVVSFTAAGNRRSVAVMERLGMTHDPRGAFDHPRLSAEDPLRRHVLYRVTAERWRAGRRGVREG